MSRIIQVPVSLAVKHSTAVARPDDTTLALRALSIWLALLVNHASHVHVLQMPASAACVCSRSITFDAICQARCPVSQMIVPIHRFIHTYIHVVGRYNAYRQFAKVRWALLLALLACLPASTRAYTRSKTASTTTITNGSLLARRRR